MDSKPQDMILRLEMISSILSLPIQASEPLALPPILSTNSSGGVSAPAANPTLVEKMSSLDVS